MSSVKAYTEDQVKSNEALADILTRLANGEVVSLGDFSDRGSPATSADHIASQLRELVMDVTG